MILLGLRCSNSDFSYAVLEGSKKRPVLREKNVVLFPKNYSRLDSLRWFFLEIDGLIKRVKPEGILIKKSEILARKSKSRDERVGNETIVLLVAALNNIKYVDCRVKSTIAKNLGYKGKGHYLKTAFDNSSLEDYANEGEKIREAILVAWSGLK